MRNVEKSEPSNSENNFQKSHTSEYVVDKSLKCEICSSLFKTKENLKRHIASAQKYSRLRCLLRHFTVQLTLK